jgi:hypothetical protein
MADLSLGGGSQGQGEEQVIEEIVMEEASDAGTSGQEMHTSAEASANDAVDAAKTADPMAEKNDEAGASKKKAPKSSARSEADKEGLSAAAQGKAKEPLVQTRLHAAPAAAIPPPLSAIRQTSGPRLPIPADLIKAADNIVLGADKFRDNALSAASTMKRVAKVISLSFFYIFHCSPRALRRKTIGIFILML